MFVFVSAANRRASVRGLDPRRHMALLTLFLVALLLVLVPAKASAEVTASPTTVDFGAVEVSYPGEIGTASTKQVNLSVSAGETDRQVVSIGVAGAPPGT